MRFSALLLLLLVLCLPPPCHPERLLASSATTQHDPSQESTWFTSYLLRRSCMDDRVLPTRRNAASITDFGGIGDGNALNTMAFQKAVSHLGDLASLGGSQLNIPAGRWLTGSFNLTSHFTLFLEKGAVIVGSQNSYDWPLIEPLPSYGRGRERLGGRHISLIHGQNLTDVVITGDNGTIDGQGSIWWNMWRTGTLNHTRGHLIEFMSSENIIITNIVLANSPFWTLHPVYCDKVVINGVTILAPRDSPNTDGIDPGIPLNKSLPSGENLCKLKTSTFHVAVGDAEDSSSNICIEDCYISNGDDLIALKSGWDEYGIAFGRSTSNIIIRRITGTTSFAGIAFGSEMSGGISNVFIQDIHLFHTTVGIRLKTVPGRGGYITNISISDMVLEEVKTAFQFTTNAGDHPDMNYNPDALSVIKDIVIKNVMGEQISYAGEFMGLERAHFRGICLSGIRLFGSINNSWTCSNVEGSSLSVFPVPCTQLQSLNWHSACLEEQKIFDVIS